MNVTCKYCFGTNIIRKGIRYTKYEDKQIFYCKYCRKKFTSGNIQNKSYAPHIIIAAVSTYSIGYTLSETQKQINRRFKKKISRSTIHNWIKENESVMTYLKIRDIYRNAYGTDIITKRIFRHKGLNYHFKYHNVKLDLRCRQTRHSRLKSFIEHVHTKGCPEYYSHGERCSTINNINADIMSNIKTKRLYNDACRLSDISLPAARSRKERHDMVESFMLLNDSSTIAVEIPVWYYEKRLNSNISGHIDIIQIRGGRIHILDYKPEAHKEKHVAQQLYHYAIALAYRTGIDISNMVCAWFDENNYYEYQPAILRI